MNKNINYLVILVLALLVVYFAFFKKSAPAPTTIVVTSFESCVSAGLPVTGTNPRQCKTTDGRVYAEEIAINPTYKNSSKDLITVENPYPGAVTGKNFTVTGSARGTWYFEASFPIEVLDKNGKTIATGIAQAQGEWMTQNFVPFKSDIKIPASYTGPATLVLKKDNPSGMPENDASISFPINIEY